MQTATDVGKNAKHQLNVHVWLSPKHTHTCGPARIGKSTMSCNFSCRIKTERFLDVTAWQFGSHVRTTAW